MGRTLTHWLTFSRHNLIFCLTECINNKQLRQKIQKTDGHITEINSRSLLIYSETTGHVVSILKKCQCPISHGNIIQINQECLILDIPFAKCCFSALQPCFLLPVSESVVSPSSSPDTEVPDSLYVVLGVVCSFCLVMLILLGAICGRNRTSNSCFGYADNPLHSVQTLFWFNYQPYFRFDCFISGVATWPICLHGLSLHWYT